MAGLEGACVVVLDSVVARADFAAVDLVVIRAGGVELACVAVIQ